MKLSKSYQVKVSFTLSGEIFDFNDENQIKEELTEEISKIALDFDQVDSEEYDECYLDEINDIKIELKEFSYEIRALPFCEHCGENHEEFGIQFNVDGTSWCLDCYNSDGHLSKEQYAEYWEKVRIAYKEYLKKKLEELE